MWLLQQGQQRSLQQQFELDIRERALALHRDISLNLEGLHALSVLFAQGQPSFADFNREAEKILTRHPDIHALEWIPKITAEQRQTWQQHNRQHYPDFQITQRQSQGRMVVAAERAVHFPVAYVVPLQGNEAALGFDLASNQTRMQTLQQSQDTGQPLASASINLVQAQGQQQGILAFLPIYRGNPRTVSARRQQLLGFVLAVYRIGDIVARSALYRDSAHLQLTLTDVSDSGHSQQIFAAPLAHAQQLSESLSYQLQLPDIWGRRWQLQAVAADGYWREQVSMLPMLMLLGGTSMATIFCLYCLLLLRRSTRVYKKLQRKTAELNAANCRLSELAKTDPLTGVANRRAFNEALKQVWQRCHRHGGQVALLMIDVDYFKAYNDRHGHIAGDRCLQQVASCLAQQCRRSNDLLARYGGEEFAMVLPDTDKPLQLAQHCLQAVSDLNLHHGGLPEVERITISIGIANLQPRQCAGMADLIHQADRALYKAKQQGRNRVVESDYSNGQVVPLVQVE
ncbi:diguanylate cyclase domain-containing protein [Ferrimonas senticii]|uniref:diguanylate cyclase domain-containing protein n=1 Tax=Ferrimonas senticii TaxID=394566 RepID=UPI0004102449|nr:diguanylate cyclase [Ferrimonas senticii]